MAEEVPKAVAAAIAPSGAVVGESEVAADL